MIAFWEGRKDDQAAIHKGFKYICTVVNILKALYFF